MSKIDSKILMVGTSFETMGGIATVVNAYREDGLFERYHINYITTHCDGTALKKLFFAISALLSFSVLVMRPKIKVVHIHVASHSSFWRKVPFILYAKLWKKKVIFHLHGADFKIFFDEKLSPRRRKFASYVINQSDIVLALSQTWGEWLRGVAIKPQVVVLVNSIVPIDFPKNIEKKSSQLLFLGRVGERKGFWDLLQALRNVKAKGLGFRLLVGGDGELDKARQLTIDYGLETSIEFVGWVTSEQKLKLLASSSLYLLPSHHEGMPMSILEALAAGLPIVTTNVGGIPEQVADGVEGYVIEPGDIDLLADKICCLLGSADLREMMSKRARVKFNSCFSTIIVLPKLEEIYDSLSSK